MSKYFYAAAIVLVGLYVILTLSQNVIYLELGYKIFLRHAFIPWFLFSTTVYFLVLLALLKYYHYKSYLPAFSSVIILIIAALFYFFTNYSLLTTKEFESFYPTSYLVFSGATMLHYTSLLMKDAGNRRWLKATGIFGIMFQFVSILTFSPALNLEIFGIMPDLENFRIWASFANNFLPLLFIFNFLNELRVLKAEQLNTYRSGTLQGIIAGLCIVSIVLSVILGRNLMNNPDLAPGNVNKVTERAQNLARAFESRIFVNSQGDTMRYRLMKPLNYDSKKQYPLVVCLHHGGAHGTDNVIQVEASQPAPFLSKAGNRIKYPAFVFVPQCPPGGTWGGITNAHGIDLLVFETINALEREFSIDVKRRYVAGNSLGGFGSWHFICTRPEMFAAAIPISGGGDPKLAERITHVAVWAFHGEQDKNVPVRSSRDMIEAIKNNGGTTRYTEIPNAGHNIGDVINDTPGLMDWLFAQKRD